MPSPITLSTWSFGMVANAAAWPILTNGGRSLDAVEAACVAVELDPKVDSVGIGGLPDATGRVTLDGCIMQSPERCGGVADVTQFAHPVSIARRVMEKTHHVLLVGKGADAFAAAEGFEPVNLLSDAGRAEWNRWKEDPSQLTDDRYRGWIPPRNIEEMKGAGAGAGEHDRASDTVGVLALDQAGALAGACSTSGMAFKLPGRVGDSPIIGHALYVDPKYGAAVCTGTGELFMQTCGAFLAVEKMRNGLSPLDAAIAVIERIMDSITIHADHQAAVIALAPDGTWSSAAMRPGFRVAVTNESRNELIPADRILLNDHDPAGDDAPQL